MSLKPGKRQIRSDKNKKLIYTCAIRLFREHGYQNVSVEDIVEASGMSVGTFYHYFKSKDELPVLFLETYLQNSFDEYEERVLIPNHESRVPILDQLCAFLIFAQSLPHEGGEDFLRVATMYMLKEGSEEVAYHYILDPDRPFARICRKLLREGQSCGEIRSDKHFLQWDRSAVLYEPHRYFRRRGLRRRAGGFYQSHDRSPTVRASEYNRDRGI